VLKIKYLWPFCSALLFLSAQSPAKAQDIFQTEESTRSYNYVQAVYVFDQENIDYPFLFNARVSVHPNFALSGEYRNLSARGQQEDGQGNVSSVKAEVEEFKLGLSGHLPSERWTRIDWIASAFYQVSQLTTTRTGFRANVTTITAAVFEAGVRGTITPTFEVQAIVSIGSDADGQFVAENAQLDLTGVVRIMNQFDVAVGVLDAASGPLYNLGVRYSW